MMHKNDLIQVDQSFVDSAYLMLDKDPPRAPSPSPNPKKSSTPVDLQMLEAVVNLTDPDSPRLEWFTVGTAISTETGGSDDGFIIFNEWSSRGTKYPGEDMVLKQWKSFRPDIENPNTIASIVYIAKQQGADVGSVIKQFDEFEPCETKIIDPQKATKQPQVESPVTGFDSFSLTGMSDQLEREAEEQVPVLGEFALLGQTTVLCAEGNTGKTLIAMKLLTESIAAKRIDPVKTYYLNMDDDYKGLITKTKIAEEFGFNMLAEGYNKFSAKSFLGLIQDINRKNRARGVVIMLDTLKKFVNVMQKGESREFNAILREFSSKGGTIIALAHVNKKRGPDGRPIFAGTSDLKDDFDCMFLLWLISDRGAKEKIVILEKEKGRGPVVEKACYGYISGRDVSYNEMLLSVREVEEDQIVALEQADSMRSDGEVIDAVISCINEGINTKMLLAEAASERSGASKRSTLQLIEKYAGDDPVLHRWFFVRGERGKQVFTILDISSPGQSLSEAKSEA